MRETALAHLVGDRFRAAIGECAPDDAQVATVAVGPAIKRRDHFERAGVQERLQLDRRLLAEPRFLGAARMMRFRCVDADDPHAALAEPESVAVDDAGETSAAAATGKGLGDALWLGRE